MKLPIAALIIVLLTFPSLAQDNKKESVYERVMRTGVMKCGYSIWPPYKDRDINTGKEIGIDIEISEQLADILDIKIEFVEVVLGQSIEDLNSSKIDAMCGTGAWQLSTIKHVDFSEATYYAPVHIYGRADEERFNVLSDLDSPEVTFVAIDGDLSTDLKNRLFPKAKVSSLPQLAQPSQLLLDITLSKADVTIFDPQAAINFNKNNKNKVKPLFEKPLAVYGLGFSVKKGEKDMLNLINSTVNVMKDVGVITPILDKYDPNNTFLLKPQNNYKSK